MRCGDFVPNARLGAFERGAEGGSPLGAEPRGGKALEGEAPEIEARQDGRAGKGGRPGENFDRDAGEPRGRDECRCRDR